MDAAGQRVSCLHHWAAPWALDVDVDVLPLPALHVAYVLCALIWGACGPVASIHCWAAHLSRP